MIRKIKNKSKLFPAVSIVIATFNSERTLPECLKSVKKQVYPGSVDIIIADGGSIDKTLSLAREFNIQVISIDKEKQNAEYNKAVGLSKAKGDIVLFLDHDNIMPHKNWIKALVRPFLEHKEIVIVEPLRFHYDPNMTLLDRYFALYGGSDPVVYYLGKNSHLSWAYDSYHLLGKAIDCGSYYKVQFSKDKIPALGGNGAAFRREILLRNADTEPQNFIHTDVAADLIRNGFNSVAFTKDSIANLTNNKIAHFLLRRRHFLQEYYFRKSRKRRFLIYDPKKDTGMLIFYILLTLTFVVPFLGALRGFRKIHDYAWFIQPFMCYAFLVVYGFAVVKERIYGFLEK